MEEVFALLKATKKGLTSAEAEERLSIFGKNRLEEIKVGQLRPRHDSHSFLQR